LLYKELTSVVVVVVVVVVVREAGHLLRK